MSGAGPSRNKPADTFDVWAALFSKLDPACHAPEHFRARYEATHSRRDLLVRGINISTNDGQYRRWLNEYHRTQASMKDVVNDVGTVDERLAIVEDLERTYQKLMDEKGGEDKFRRWVKRGEKAEKLADWHATMDQDRDLILEGIAKLKGEQEAAEWAQRLAELDARCPEAEVPVEMYGEYEALYKDILDSKGGRESFKEWAGVEVRDPMTTEWTSVDAVTAAEQIERIKDFAAKST